MMLENNNSKKVLDTGEGLVVDLEGNLFDPGDNSNESSSDAALEASKRKVKLITVRQLLPIDTNKEREILGATCDTIINNLSSDDNIHKHALEYVLELLYNHSACSMGASDIIKVREEDLKTIVKDLEDRIALESMMHRTGMESFDIHVIHFALAKYFSYRKLINNDIKARVSIHSSLNRYYYEYVANKNLEKSMHGFYVYVFSYVTTNNLPLYVMDWLYEFCLVVPTDLLLDCDYVAEFAKEDLHLSRLLRSFVIFCDNCNTGGRLEGLKNRSFESISSAVVGLHLGSLKGYSKDRVRDRLTIILPGLADKLDNFDILVACEINNDSNSLTIFGYYLFKDRRDGRMYEFRAYDYSGALAKDSMNLEEVTEDLLVGRYFNFYSNLRSDMINQYQPIIDAYLRDYFRDNK